MSDALTGLAEHEVVCLIRADVLAEIRDELRLLNQKLDAALNGNGDVGFYDVERGATYLSLSKGAFERAVRRGTIESFRTANGLTRCTKEQLDRYATANGTKP
jgi:hypothetical protein